MKLGTAGAILVTVITTTEGKKSKTGDSKDGAYKPGSTSWGDDWKKDNDDWSLDDDWRPSDSWKWSSSGKTGKSGSDWWGSGKSGKSGSSRDGQSPFFCEYKTFFLDLDDILDDPKSTEGGITTTYTNFKVYKDSSSVGDKDYDGVFSFQRTRVSDSSCQGQAMLGINGRPIFTDQLYASTMCDPMEDDPEKSGYITDGGITGGFGSFAGATGTMVYDISSDNIGKLKFWFCLPNGLKNSWGSSSDSWDH
jgi:hypothetical protein